MGSGTRGLNPQNVLVTTYAAARTDLNGDNVHPIRCWRFRLILNILFDRRGQVFKSTRSARLFGHSESGSPTAFHFDEYHRACAVPSHDIDLSHSEADVSCHDLISGPAQEPNRPGLAKRPQSMRHSVGIVTGRKLSRWSAHGPCVASASRCSFVPYPLWQANPY